MSAGSPVLTEVRSHGRGSKRRTLVVDGEPWRCVSAAVVRELGLRSGDTIDIGDLEKQIAEAALRLARERALRLLAARERTTSELLKRLLEDGYDEATSRATVERLADTGLVNDERFAEAMARSLIVSRGLGRGRALRELTRKGVGDELAASALDELAAPEGESRRAGDAARRLVRAGDSVPRLAARLARRGFAPGEAFSAARETLPDRPEDQPFEDS